MPRTVAVAATAALVVGTLAAVAMSLPNASAATINSVRSFDGGTLTAGQSKSYTWNNANTDIYQVGTAAVKDGDPNTPCWIDVTKQWYERAASGTRYFKFTLKNVDSFSCDVKVYLALITADRSGATGGIGTREAITFTGAIADPWKYLDFAAVTPDQPSTGTCKLEVTWFMRTKSTGAQQLVWTVHNTGTVLCGGTWRIGRLPVDEARDLRGNPARSPGYIDSFSSLDRSPFRAYLFGMIPGTTSLGDCNWGPRYRQSSGDPAGPSYRASTAFGVKNNGATTCKLLGVTQAFIG